MFSVMLFIVTAIGFALAMIVAARLFRRNIPTPVSPDVARKHVPLVCLICWPQIVVAVALFALATLIVLGFLLSINPFQRQSAYSEAYSVIMWIIALLVATAIIAKSIERHRKSSTRLFQNILRVDSNSVSAFAFIFAALASHDLYYFLPPWNPKVLHDHPGLVALFLNRDFLSLIVFCVVWYLIKTCILNLLEIGST
jgi:hypothetical protein